MPPNTTTRNRVAGLPPETHGRVTVLFDDKGELLDYELGPTEAQWARAWRCWLLAPTLATYEALLKGEKVPTDQLDHNGVRRLWKRPA